MKKITSSCLLALSMSLALVLGSSNVLADEFRGEHHWQGGGNQWHNTQWHNNGNQWHNNNNQWHNNGNQWNGNWHGGGSATTYFFPGSYYPYYNYPYYNSMYQTTPIYPDDDVNSCPLIPSHYDAAGNWVAATRVCATGDTDTD